MRAGSDHLAFPRATSFSSIQSRKRVRDAMRPAAAGMGKPVNSLFADPESMAARQLNRARRRAPQTR